MLYVHSTDITVNECILIISEQVPGVFSLYSTISTPLLILPSGLRYKGITT